MTVIEATPQTTKENMLVLLAFIIGPVALYAPKGLLFVEVLMAVLLGVMAWHKKDLAIGRVLKTGAPFFILALLAIISALWAIDAHHSLVRGGRLFIEVLLGMFVFVHLGNIDYRLSKKVIWWFVVGFALALASVWATGLYIVDWSKNFPEGGNSNQWTVLHGRGAVVASILAPSLLAYLFKVKNYLGLILVSLASLPVMFSLLNSTLKISIFIGVIVFCVVLFMPFLRHVILSGLVVIMLLLPFFFPFDENGSLMCKARDLKLSASHRLYIWNFSAEKIHEKPILGWGMDSSRMIPGGKEKFALSACTKSMDIEVFQYIQHEEYMPLHPHNFIMQIWLELGGVGAALAAFAFGWMGFGAMRAKTRWSAAIVSASISSAFVVASLSFGIWQGWWIASLFLCAGIVWMVARTVDKAVEVDGN